jgi:hypothetical protein
MARKNRSSRSAISHARIAPSELTSNTKVHFLGRVSSGPPNFPKEERDGHDAVHRGRLDRDPRLPRGAAAHEAVEVDSGEDVGGALEVDHMPDALQRDESLDAVQELGDGGSGWSPRCR